MFYLISDFTIQQYPRDVWVVIRRSTTYRFMVVVL